MEEQEEEEFVEGDEGDDSQEEDGASEVRRSRPAPPLQPQGSRLVPRAALGARAWPAGRVEACGCSACRLVFAAPRRVRRKASQLSTGRQQRGAARRLPGACLLRATARAARRPQP